MMVMTSEPEQPQCDRPPVDPDPRADPCQQLRLDSSLVPRDSLAGFKLGFENTLSGTDETATMTASRAAALCAADQTISPTEAVDSAELKPHRHGSGEDRSDCGTRKGLSAVVRRHADSQSRKETAPER